jgi:predicted nuclease of predicted toxin-antitoxin system
VRILLDENLLSPKLKKPLTEAGHEVRNVDDMGWRGTKDAQLLALANDTPFDIFITADKNLPYQQNLQGLTLCIIVLNASSTRPAQLIPLIIKSIPLLTVLNTGSVTLIDEESIA